jgi:hypothetical protein
MYHLMRLFTLTTESGWKVLALKHPPGSKRQLVAVKGPGAGLTIIGLDSRGARKNVDTQTPVTYTIGALQPNATFTHVLWNRAGGGRLASEGTVRANSAGEVKVTAPLHSVFALTTKAVTV